MVGTSSYDSFLGLPSSPSPSYPLLISFYSLWGLLLPSSSSSFLLWFTVSPPPPSCSSSYIVPAHSFNSPSPYSCSLFLRLNSSPLASSPQPSCHIHRDSNTLLYLRGDYQDFLPTKCYNITFSYIITKVYIIYFLFSMVVFYLYRMEQRGVVSVCRRGGEGKHKN